MRRRPLFELGKRKSVRAFLAFLISIILAFAASTQPQSPNERLYSKNKGGDPDAWLLLTPHT